MILKCRPSVLVLIALVGIVAGIGVFTRGGVAGPAAGILPSFSMGYQVAHAAPNGTSIETVKLEYRGANDWVSTVVSSEADPGSAGSYLRYDGKLQTWHDPRLTPDTWTTPAPQDGVVVPAPWFIPRDWKNYWTPVESPRPGVRAYANERRLDCTTQPVGAEVDTPDAVPTALASGFEAPTEACVVSVTTESITIDAATGIPLEYTETTDGVLTTRFEVLQLKVE